MIHPDDLDGITHNHVENASGDSKLYIANYTETDIVETILNRTGEYSEITDLRMENRRLLDEVDGYTDEVLHVLDNEQDCGYRWIKAKLDEAEKLVNQVEKNVQETEIDGLNLTLYQPETKKGLNNYLEKVRKGINSIERKARKQYPQTSIEMEANAAAD